MYGFFWCNIVLCIIMFWLNLEKYFLKENKGKLWENDDKFFLLVREFRIGLRIK